MVWESNSQHPNPQKTTVSPPNFSSIGKPAIPVFSRRKSSMSFYFDDERDNLTPLAMANPNKSSVSCVSASFFFFFPCSESYPIHRPLLHSRKWPAPVRQQSYSQLTALGEWRRFRRRSDRRRQSTAERHSATVVGVAAASKFTSGSSRTARSPAQSRKGGLPFSFRSIRSRSQTSAASDRVLRLHPVPPVAGADPNESIASAGAGISDFTEPGGVTSCLCASKSSGDLRPALLVLFARCFRLLIACAKCLPACRLARGRVANVILPFARPSRERWRVASQFC